MRKSKSYKYFANDDRFDIKSNLSKVNEYHTEKSIADKYDAYKPEAYRSKLNNQVEQKSVSRDSKKSGGDSSDENLSVENYIEKRLGKKYKITSVKAESEHAPQIITVKSGNGCLLTFIVILLIMLIIIITLNSISVIVPLDATPEEVKEAFEKAFHLFG